MIRILIVEDETLLRELMAQSIHAQQDMLLVGETAKASEACALCAAHQPDLVLMDIKTEDGSGIQATAEIKRSFPDVKVLILTALLSESLLSQALEAGANGYANKTVSASALIEIIRHTAAGYVFSAVDGRGTSAQKPPFSPLEIKILLLLSQGRTAREIAEELHFSHGTVRNYISSMITRMGFHDRVHLVSYAITEGIIG